MKKRYCVPEVLGADILKTNEAVAVGCLFIPVEGSYWGLYDVGGAMGDLDWDYEYTLDWAIEHTDTHINDRETAAGHLVGVFKVQVGNEYYYYEDYYPHFLPEALVWEYGKTNIPYPADPSQPGGVHQDNWQDQHGNRPEAGIDPSTYSQIVVYS